jgi:hypothetical protein
VAFSLLGYFLYIITVFTAIMASLIGLFNNSALEKVLHYPRPIIVRTVTATNTEPRHLVVSSGTKQGVPAKDSPAKDLKDSRVSVAKTDAQKSKRERPAHLAKLVRQRKNYEGHGSTIALGYVQDFGYRPGLDGQR